MAWTARHLPSGLRQGWLRWQLLRSCGLPWWMPILLDARHLPGWQVLHHPTSSPPS